MILAGLKKAHLTAEGPQTLKEKSKLLNEQRKIDKQKLEKQKKDNISFSNYFKEIYLKFTKRKKKIKTWKNENSLFKIWIEPVIGDMLFKDINHLHLDQIQNNMTDAGKAPRTIQYAFSVIRQTWNSAKKNNIISKESPTLDVKLKKISNLRKRFLTKQEADLLLKELKNRSQQLYEIALISLHCGLRANEIFSLKFSDCDSEKKLMNIFDAKTGDRISYMTNIVKDIILNKKYNSKSEFIFKTKKNEKINQISGSFSKVVDKIGLNDGITDRRSKVVFHTLRHTFCSWHMQNGQSLFVLKKLMGHGSIKTTERYSHVGKNDLTNAVDLFEEKYS